MLTGGGHVLNWRVCEEIFNGFTQKARGINPRIFETKHHDFRLQFCFHFFLCRLNNNLYLLLIKICLKLENF